MQLAQCEVFQNVIRGKLVAFIFGPAPLTDEGRAALLAEFVESRGPGLVPAYVSPVGWQALNAAAGEGAAAKELADLRQAGVDATAEVATLRAAAEASLAKAAEQQAEIDRLTAELAAAKAAADAKPAGGKKSA